jgi:arginine deiminase
MTYTRDLARVFSTGAVLMGPHLVGRRGDEWLVGRALERLGVPLLGHIDEPGYLEGGGVTLIGHDTVVASICDRANLEGTGRLRELVLGRDARAFLEVPLPPGHIHIDGIFMMLDERLCLIHEPTFTTRPCRLYEEGRDGYREVKFLDYLDSRGIERIAITEAERRLGHLNVVVTERGGRAVGFAEAVRIRDELARRGWQLDTFPSAELFRGNGGAHCMTCPLLVTE